MSSTTSAPRLSDKELIARYVGTLHDEFARIEPPCLPAPVEARLPADDPAPPEMDRDDHNIMRVAPWDGTAELTRQDFFEVRCREVSAGGIAFWVEQPPQTPFFVVKFKMNDETVYVKSRVAHAHPDLTVDSSAYLVDSKFAGRVDPALTASLSV